VSNCYRKLFSVLTTRYRYGISELDRYSTHTAMIIPSLA
jgi:hypothetical protein